MTIVVYFFILLIAALFIGSVMFMGFSTYKHQFDFQSLVGASNDVPDLFFWSSISKTETYTDRGRWILFSAIFLLVIELFAFLFYIVSYSSTISLNNAAELPWFAGGFIFLLLLVFSIVLAARLIGASREYPSLADGFYPTRKNWEERLSTLNESQKRQLANYFIEHLNTLEKSFVAGSVMLSAAVTLFLIWITVILSKFIG